MGIEGKIEFKGSQNPGQLRKKVVTGGDGYKIEGDFVDSLPYDVKITKEGSDFKATFKIDDLEHLKKASKLISQTPDSKNMPTGIFKCGDGIEFKGQFFALTPHG